MYHGIKFTDLKEILAFIVNNYDASIDYINNFIKTRLDQSMEEDDEIPPPLDYKRLTYQIGEHTETIDIEVEESDALAQALDDILVGIKEQYERNECEPVVIQRKELMDQLSTVTNAPKKNVWSQITEITGLRWTFGPPQAVCATHKLGGKDSKTEIEDGTFKYKITY